MRWVPDRTGRFDRRPHFDPSELDQECESIVSTFLRTKHAALDYPISTNDLIILLEQEAADLDLYSDLSGEGTDVEGLTVFSSRGKPRVQIAKELSEQPWRENRLRTTITHELGHVRFHNVLLAVDERQARFDLISSPDNQRTCKRETILDAPQVDWMEWQAGYACGAFLMPFSAVKRVALDFRETSGASGILTLGSRAGQELIRRVQSMFQVSSDAARVRLLKLKFLVEGNSAQSFFDL